MRHTKNNIKIVARFFIAAMLMVTFGSCKKFVDVELPGSKVTVDLVFADDNTASAAVVGLYYDLSTSVISTGSVNSLGRLAALSSDELYDYSRQPLSIEFEENYITSGNNSVLALWNSFYKVIYDANSVLEGLDRSTKLTPSVKKQLEGEALFVRSFCYFYLVNFFGDVPIVLTTDYLVNSSVVRNSSATVYSQIVSDLISAKSLLADAYVGGERVRANSQAAASLLAKVYLFMEQWELAIEEANDVISDAKYQIVSNLNDVFLVNSPESIWQIAPADPLNITDEASFYVITSGSPYLVFRNDFVSSFDISDLRLLNWIGVALRNSTNIYFPHKYKTQAAGLPIKELSTVLRLAEQYLIRAEAHARSGNLEAAITDVDVIRERSGLSSIADENPGITDAALLAIIENERKFELFTEWGSRWFDLKRLDRAEQVLSPIKTGFTIEDELYPIPALEFNKNPSLGNQNAGY